MASSTGVVLFTVTACALLRFIFAPESFLQGAQESASGSGSGDDQQPLAPQVRKLHVLRCKFRWRRFGTSWCSWHQRQTVYQCAKTMSSWRLRELKWFAGDFVRHLGSQLLQCTWTLHSISHSLHAAERRCRCAEVPDVGSAVPPTPLTPQGTLYKLMCHVHVSVDYLVNV